MFERDIDNLPLVSYISIMSIETRKLQLIQKLAAIDNERLIGRIEQLINETVEERYKRELGNGNVDSLINMVREGEEDIAAGRTYTSDEVETYFRRKRE